MVTAFRDRLSVHARFVSEIRTLGGKSDFGIVSLLRLSLEVFWVQWHQTIEPGYWILKLNIDFLRSSKTGWSHFSLRGCNS
jgi:hypothetical protein